MAKGCNSTDKACKATKKHPNTSKIAIHESLVSKKCEKVNKSSTKAIYKTKGVPSLRTVKSYREYFSSDLHIKANFKNIVSYNAQEFVDIVLRGNVRKRDIRRNLILSIFLEFIKFYKLKVEINGKEDIIEKCIKSIDSIRKGNFSTRLIEMELYQNKNISSEKNVVNNRNIFDNLPSNVEIVTLNFTENLKQNYQHEFELIDYPNIEEMFENDTNIVSLQTIMIDYLTEFGNEIYKTNKFNELIDKKIYFDSKEYHVDGVRAMEWGWLAFIDSTIAILMNKTVSNHSYHKRSFKNKNIIEKCIKNNIYNTNDIINDIFDSHIYENNIIKIPKCFISAKEFTKFYLSKNRQKDTKKQMKDWLIWMLLAICELNSLSFQLKCDNNYDLLQILIETIDSINNLFLSVIISGIRLSICQQTKIKNEVNDMSEQSFVSEQANIIPNEATNCVSPATVTIIEENQEFDENLLVSIQTNSNNSHKNDNISTNIDEIEFNNLLDDYN